MGLPRSAHSALEPPQPLSDLAVRALAEDGHDRPQEACRSGRLPSGAVSKESSSRVGDVGP